MRLTPTSRVTATKYKRWLCALAAVAVVAGATWALVWPEVVRARISRNESAAIATLMNLSSAQSQMQASGVCDADGNGQGEHAFLGQLAGVAPLRCPVGEQPRLCDPPVVSAVFADVVDGRVRIGGYWLEVYLPAEDGGWVREGQAGDRVSPRRSETVWLCYAYPVEHGVTGNRAFMLNHAGNLIVTDQLARERKYGADHRPSPGVAGFAPGSALAPLREAAISVHTVDRAGDYWRII